jgi:alpha-ketoglutarate-dependent taurine dioxygenase
VYFKSREFISKLISFRVKIKKREYVFTAVSRTRWHIDGSSQPAPFPYSLYHMVCVPLKGDTVVAPLNETVKNLPSVKINEWEKLWMMSD